MRLTTKGRFAVTAMIDVALHGARGPVTLRFAEPVKVVERVNLLEEPEGGRIELGDGGRTVQLDVRPFEVISLGLASPSFQLDGAGLRERPDR